ncbi:integrase core domain protein [Oesophagostomum dentatum]|uniref:Integrase core domain protein n=1 Tax=Oesophagostomum dentatum TaxID=61180 RepID=A0A0B1SUX4_OESDE|nr:integrase core domain protein [Oesophagostomum dentatum]
MGIPVKFYHVPTKDNPADAGSRGLTTKEIVTHDWVRGPRWLRTHPNHWPLKPIEMVTAEEVNEPADMIVSTPIEIPPEQKQDEKIIDLKRFSKYNKALLSIALACKTAKKWVSLTSTNKNLEIKLKVINKFQSDLEISVDDLTRLIIEKLHTENGHCGKEHTLCIARQRFWIPRPARAYANIVKKCIICKKYQGPPYGAPIMGPLPRDRVIISKPFENVGCDFMGPFSSKTNEKMYVCLFTCLTTRAIHLEVVENLSAGAFLNSFIRFISRRGVPAIVRSDCGTNFKLGEAIIQKMFEKCDENGLSLMSYCASERIRWLFNPPASPWMGGAWERLVGLVKKAFNKSIGRKRLNFADMCTVIARIEAIVNTRPLTKLNSSDITELPLRPVDFLRGNLMYSIPTGEIVDASDDPCYDPELIQTEKQAKEAIQFSEKIVNQFWEKWNLEYLTSLRETQKINLKQPKHLAKSNPEVGEIVLLEQDLIPRGCWSYGRIIAIVKSADGLIRSAKIILPNRNVIQRPLNRIFPLEIRSLPKANTPEDSPQLRPPKVTNEVKNQVEKEEKLRENSQIGLQNLALMK